MFVIAKVSKFKAALALKAVAALINKNLLLEFFFTKIETV